MSYYLAPIFTAMDDDGRTSKGPGTGAPLEKALVRGLQTRGWDMPNSKVLVLTTQNVPSDWEEVDEDYVRSNFPGAI